MSQGKSAIDVEEKCFHCGLPCEAADIVLNEKHFCCEGCKTVYGILSQNDLEDYYSLELNPGNNLQVIADEQKFSFLDNEKIQQKLLIFRSENYCKVQFFIPSIHCSSCIWLLENLGQLNEGIVQSSVNFSKKEVYIDFDPSLISLKEIGMLLASIGYEPLINLEQATRKVTKTRNTDLIVKIGIAGFSFGNIMLLSFPEYLGFESTIEPQFQSIFTWAMVILSIPVLLYCSIDYFRSSLFSLRQRQINIDVPIAIGIISLYARSLYEILTQTGQGYLDSFAGLIFFLLIGKWFQNKTYQGLSYDRDYRSYFPLAVTKITDRHHEEIISTDLEVGDRIFIRNKELIPADSILISASASIDYSFVTGESNPVECRSGSEIFAGGKQIGSAIELEVVKEVSGSYLSKLWDNEAFKSNKNSSNQTLIDRVSRYFTLAILGIALISGAAWAFTSFGTAVNVFTAVLIVACPCALALSTPFTLGSTLRVFGTQNLYLRNTQTIETLNGITHIVFDKTGTITESEKTRIHFEGNGTVDLPLQVASLARNSTHPLSRGLSEFLEIDQFLHVEDFEEIEGKGIAGKIDGVQIRIGSASFTRGPQSTNYVTAVHVSVGERYLGKYVFQNSYRQGLTNLINRLSKDYSLSVLSGDNDSELKNLKKILPQTATILFNQSPYDKLDYIRSLQQKGEQVLMLGDGLNDAGALRQSDVGVAVTENITSFTPASDGILQAARVTQLDRFLSFTRTSRSVVIASFVISFVYNLTGLTFAVAGLLTPLFAAILMPLSSITIVIFTTSAVTLLGKKEFL